jgi:hypothetical protein
MKAIYREAAVFKLESDSNCPRIYDEIIFRQRLLENGLFNEDVDILIEALRRKGKSLVAGKLSNNLDAVQDSIVAVGKEKLDNVTNDNASLIGLSILSPEFLMHSKNYIDLEYLLVFSRQIEQKIKHNLTASIATLPSPSHGEGFEANVLASAGTASLSVGSQKDHRTPKQSLESILNPDSNYKYMNLSAGSKLFSRGSRATSIYFLKQGIVELTGKHGEKICYLPGELFSFEDIVFANDVHHTDAVAKTPIEILPLERSYFLHILTYHPTLVLLLIQQKHDRLRNLRASGKCPY